MNRDEEPKKELSGPRSNKLHERKLLSEYSLFDRSTPPNPKTATLKPICVNHSISSRVVDVPEATKIIARFIQENEDIDPDVKMSLEQIHAALEQESQVCFTCQVIFTHS